MFRASSEIAVVMRTWSVVENASFSARSRPFRRAVTMSPSERIVTSASVSAGSRSLTFPVLELKESEAFLEIERRRHLLEHQPELHHREGDFGLDPDDHRVRAAQADHVRDVAQRPRGER